MLGQKVVTLDMQSISQMITVYEMLKILTSHLYHA
jgi:hypothetical protein